MAKQTLSVVASAVWRERDTMDAYYDDPMSTYAPSECATLVRGHSNRRVREAVEESGWEYGELLDALSARVNAKWLYQSGLAHLLDDAFPREAGERWRERERARDLISEALRYGLDVDPDTCDASLLADDVARLRRMEPDARAAAVARLNDGEPIDGFTRCPKCGSADTRKATVYWQCLTCGAEWLGEEA